MPDCPLGWVQLDGHRLPIRSVSLADGKVRIEYELRGPLPALRGHVTVFGEDGKGCWQGHEAAYPDIPCDQIWVCRYELRMDNVGTWDTLADYTNHPIG